MMCFVPATFEIVGIVLLAPKLMGLSILEAAIMGAVLAAVSPAVVVPRMVKLMEEGYGVKQGIPQLILAGASVDDVYVIVLFSTFTGMMQGQSTSILSFINIPVSIFLGIGIGLLIGTCLAYYFKKVHIRDTSKVLIILSISLLLVVMEDSLNTAITFSALIAIMFIGIGLQKKREVVAKRISVKYGKLWVAAEVFLFVLVGANSTIPTISNGAGTKHIITAGLPIFLSPERSRPRPALVRMIISAIFRSSAEIPRILSSNRFSTYGPSIIPVIIIPSKLGSLIFLQIQPIDIPTSKIKAILSNIY